MNKNEERIIDDIIQTCAAILNPALSMSTPRKQMVLNIGLLINTFKEQGNYAIKPVDAYFTIEDLNEWMDRYIMAINRFNILNKNIHLFDAEFIRSISGQKTLKQ